MKWQTCTGYGKRSLVETAIGRYKALIGQHLRVRSFLAQQTEAALGCAALTACLPAHARNPSGAMKRPHRQPHQRPASAQVPIPAPTPSADEDVAAILADSAAGVADFVDIQVN